MWWGQAVRFLHKKSWESQSLDTHCTLKVYRNTAFGFLVLTESRTGLRQGLHPVGEAQAKAARGVTGIGQKRAESEAGLTYPLPWLQSQQ